MSRTARVAASSGHALIRFGGADYDCAPGETVLDALLRHGLALAHSCRKGVCLSCALRAPDGSVPAEAQAGLRPTLAAQGYFLSCLFAPESDVSVAACDDALFGRARVTSVDHIGPIVARVRLDPATPLHYRAGQFINLRRSDGVTRSYSLASVPGLDRDLELHAKRLPGGVMSNWIHDQLQPGDDVDIGGPNGASYYLSGRPEQSMLLVGNGTGLAPLYGIAREALRDGHSGPIHLYHGTSYS